jgi:hypothetical protein
MLSAFVAKCRFYPKRVRLRTLAHVRRVHRTGVDSVEKPAVPRAPAGTARENWSPCPHGRSTNYDTPKMEALNGIAGFSRGSWSQIGYLPEGAWINLSGPRRSCEAQAISPNSHLTGRTKTSCLICESGSDSMAPAAKNGRFLAVENGRDRRSRTSKARLLLTHSPPLNRCLPINTKLPKLARQILRYLREHPEAQDTVEGIMVWWVSERAIKHWLPQVRRSLAVLVARGYLEKRMTVDGRVFYRVDPSRPTRRESSRQ